MISARLLASVAMVAALVGCGSDAPAPAAPVAAASVPAAAPAPAVITQESARACIEAFEAAQKREDVEGTAAYLAEDVDFRLQAVPVLNMPEKHMNKAEALDEMRDGMAKATDRSYSSQIRVVRVSPDGQFATADLSIVNHFTVQGTAFVSTADQVYTVALRNGEPKIVSIDSRSTSLSANGNTRRF